MGRNIMTLLGFGIVALVISKVIQGDFEMELGINVLIYLVCVILLWIPPKILYKIPFLKESDRRFFRYKIFRKIFRKVMKFLVGQKEVDEMEAIFKED